jgi:hypothetical protein
MPSVWLSAVTLSTYRQTASWTSAALWLQFWLAAFATYWFSLFLLANFDETLIGGKVAFLASGTLALSSIGQFANMKAENWRPQFGLRTLLLTMTASAVGTAGWLRYSALMAECSYFTPSFESGSRAGLVNRPRRKGLAGRILLQASTR